MGRCAYGTLITLFVILFTFSLMLLIGRTVFLSSFLKGATVTVVPMNMQRTKCHLISSHREVCDDKQKSWVTVWALGPPHHSSSLTDSAIVSPFISHSTLEDAEFDQNKYPVNRTYECMCPFSPQENHTYASVCDFSQACMLDVEEVEGLLSMQRSERSHYKYIATIIAVVGVFLLLIAIGGGISIGIIMWYRISWLPNQTGTNTYQQFSSDKMAKFTIGEE